MSGWILLVIIAVPVLLGVAMYNRLVALRQARNNAFADIDVQLRQRWQLVPQLVESVKAYAGHEKEVLEKVTEARAEVGRVSGAGADRAKAEGALGSALTGLFGVAEAYPQLKADANFRQIMTELSDIENKIAAARRFFNNATGEYNTSVQQFPANLFAGAFGFHAEPFFELETGQEAQIRQGPEVKFS
jgi:LemA protein